MQFSEVVDRPASEIMTLDEPVYKTLVCFPAFFVLSSLHTFFHFTLLQTMHGKHVQWRDVKNMLLKLLQVLLPFRTWSNIHDWDLWGPLFICLTLAVFAIPCSQRPWCTTHSPPFLACTVFFA